MRRRQPPPKTCGLRHGYVHLALASGLDLKVISELMGHSSITLTAVTYGGVIAALRQEAVRMNTSPGLPQGGES